MLKNNIQVEATILSIALLTVITGAAISPALASISEAFKNTDAATIKLVLTLPSLLIAFFALISSKLCDIFGKKNILMISLILYLLGGVAGGMVQTIEELLFFRVLLGVAVGLMIPISISLVSDFFEGKKAIKMIGWISASNHFGGMISQLMSGLLVVLSWRYAFIAYFFAFISIFMVYRYLPKKVLKKKINFDFSEKIPRIIYFYAFAIFILMLVFYTVPINISLFVQTNGIGNSAFSGLALAMATTAAFIVGIFFQKIYDIFRIYSATIAIVVMGSGLGLLYLANGIILVLLGVALVGFGEGYLLPLLFHLTRKKVAQHQTVFALAIVTSMLYLGQFFSPIIMREISHLWLENSYRFSFQIATYISVITAIIVGIGTLLFSKSIINSAKI
ncbi:MAG: MFS transporter [Epsilonproteobacteria bacterium]|nr:MFS transporter [Campylobacterota bacterium]